MCTRFYVKKDNAEIRGLVAEAQSSRLSAVFASAGNQLLTNGEVFPSNVVSVIAPDKTGRKAVFPMKWGFRLPAGPLLINARTETAAQKPAFGESWVKRRCVIPASWYFEWAHTTDASGKRITGEKYMIRPKDAEITWLCGLYRIENGLPVFTVLTREPTKALRQIHDRMPLILPEELIGVWIDPNGDPARLLSCAQSEMTVEKAV